MLDLVVKALLAYLLGSISGSMVMDEPCILKKPDHGHVTHDSAFVLINKMPGDVRIACIQSLIRIFNLLFVFLDIFVFIGVDESTFKEKIPESIKINLITNIRVFIFGLLQKGQ